MPWPSTTTRRYRVAVTWTISSTNPPKVELGPEFTDFWSQAQSNGYDLLACDASGAVLAHQRDTFNTTTRQCIVRITCPSGLPGGATVGVVYLYWGAESTVAADPSTTVSGTAAVAYAVPPGTLAGVSLQGGTALVPSGNAYGPAVEAILPVGVATLLVAPVRLAALEVAARGGVELEDVEGLAVEVLDADSDAAPASPGSWTSGVRLAWAADRGAAILTTVTPAAAEVGLLRARAYLTGPASGALLDRVEQTTARIRGVTPVETT